MKITHIQIVRDHNFTPYNHSKNRSAMLNAIKDLSVSFSLTNGIRAKVMDLSHMSVIVRERLLGDYNLTPYNHSKNRSAWRDVECCKRYECVFLITN